jgi:hypothetical protein
MTAVRSIENERRENEENDRRTRFIVYDKANCDETTQVVSKLASE